MDNRTDDQLAEILWDYNNIQMPLEKADAIFVLCSHDTRVAQRGAQLFLDGYAPYIIFSGGAGVLTKHIFDKPEAEIFAEIAIQMGVPENKILIESKATNTGENVIFTRKLLEEKNLYPESFILVQKPFMLRRTYATFMKQWPGKRFLVTSQQVGFKDYFNGLLPKDLLISVMVGDTQRIREYPAKGFQIPQEMPDEVWDAAQELIRRGHDKHLIQ